MMKYHHDEEGTMDKQKSIKEKLCPKIDADKAWYLSLLDQDAQRVYEEEHLSAVLKMLKRVYILRFQARIAEAKQ